MEEEEFDLFGLYRCAVDVFGKFMAKFGGDAGADVTTSQYTCIKQVKLGPKLDLKSKIAYAPNTLW